MWSDFSKSTTDDAFLRSWLALQCDLIGDVVAALLLLREDAEGSYVPAAVWPDAKRDLTYLGDAAQKSLTEGRGLIFGPEDAGAAEVVAPDRVHLALPVDIEGAFLGVVILDMRVRPDVDLRLAMRRVLWGSGWLHSMLRRRQLQKQNLLVERAALSVEMLQAAQEKDSLDGAALSVVNELATLFPADRVSLGVMKRDRLWVRALSRTAWFDRKSDEVRLLESAMEEALDQDACLVYPALPGRSRNYILVAHRDLANATKQPAILTVPLKDHAGAVNGAIVLERRERFDAVDAETGELIGELLGPEFAKRLLLEQWFGGRFFAGVRHFVHRLFGPRGATVKFATLVVLGFFVFLSLATGDFRVSARTIIEGQQQRAAVAPFDAFVAAASARAGDEVREGQVLAELDDREIRLELARWSAEKEQASRKYREALSKRDGAASRIYAAQEAQAEAQVALAEHKLARTQIVAPFDAVVVSGDLSQLLGAPVERGKVLFELAPLGAYRVILQVDDRDISYVDEAQRGDLVLTGITEVTIPFTVKTITSVSTAEEGRNFFRVEAEIDDAEGRLRPGMEGVGKINVDERRLIWIWTRNFVNWLRITFWTWMP